ncbi:hypothetical protein I4F81_011859 [Pyropia yezoensis]|uniref:Uncharacterized protein n=1 Tax=Pyropia yezoensis TaxID=2788 RepID=A0ACC3CI31_PYRYE|nr:hypothetical protein I4F81_011859 [Neopyropia yezoensis]
MPIGDADANAILRLLEGKAVAPVDDAATVCFSSWPDLVCIGGVVTDGDHAVAKTLRRQALQADAEGLDVLGSSASPSQRKQGGTGRKGGPVGILYVWVLRKEGHPDDGRIYIGRVVRSGLAAADALKDRTDEHLHQSASDAFHTALRVHGASAFLVFCAMMWEDAPTQDAAEEWAALAELSFVLKNGGLATDAEGAANGKRPTFNSILPSVPFHAEARQRQRMRVAGRVADFVRQIKEFYALYHHADVPTTGCHAKLGKLLASVRTRHTWRPTLIQRFVRHALADCDVSWEADSVLLFRRTRLRAAVPNFKKW